MSIDLGISQCQELLCRSRCRSYCLDNRQLGASVLALLLGWLKPELLEMGMMFQQLVLSKQWWELRTTKLLEADKLVAFAKLLLVNA